MKQTPSILVVDDNRDLAKNIRDILDDRGYAAAAAFDAAGAIAFCGREPVDLALLDYKLPDMDGLALQEKLSRLTDADFIIITAHASVASAAEAVQCKRIVGYERKPLDMNRLTAFVEQVISRRRAEQATRKTRERLNAIFDNVRALIWQKDLTGRFVQVNRAFCDTVGRTKNEIIGRTDHDIFPPDIARQYVRDDRTVTDLGEPVRGMVEIHPKADGRQGWSLTDKLPYIENGRIDGVIGFAIDITDRMEAEENLKTALAEKETLLRELYHRTKNNMQVIGSMLSIQAGVSRNDEVMQICRELENKIQGMALVHEKLYRSKDLSRIDLKQYIRDLMDLLMESYNASAEAVRPRLEMESAPISIDTAVPCGLILNELISNAFKHAFPDGKKGEIRISLTRDAAGEIALTCADDGPGAPDGFDFRAQRTLGLQTIFLIVERQLNGTVEFESDRGLTCRMRFKDAGRGRRTPRERAENGDIRKGERTND